MPENTRIDDDGPVKHTDEHDFEGGLKKNGTDVATVGSSYTDEDAQDAVGGILAAAFTYDDASDEINMDPHVGTSDAHHAKYTITDDVEVTGSVALSSGSATVDIGVASTTTATFMTALGPATDDAEITASIQANSGGNYTLHLDEINTSVGNPTVEYDVIRVR
jgi:hypothetical protein